MSTEHDDGASLNLGLSIAALVISLVAFLSALTDYLQ